MACLRTPSRQRTPTPHGRRRRDRDRDYAHAHAHTHAAVLVPSAPPEAPAWRLVRRTVSAVASAASSFPRAAAYHRRHPPHRRHPHGEHRRQRPRSRPVPPAGHPHRPFRYMQYPWSDCRNVGHAGMGFSGNVDGWTTLGPKHPTRSTRPESPVPSHPHNASAHTHRHRLHRAPPTPRPTHTTPITRTTHPHHEPLFHYSYMTHRVKPPGATRRPTANEQYLPPPRSSVTSNPLNPAISEHKRTSSRQPRPTPSSHRRLNSKNTRKTIPQGLQNTGSGR